MNAITKATSVAVLVALGLTLGAKSLDAVEVISAATPWRAYLVLADGVYGQGEQLQYRTARGKLAPFDPATAAPAPFRVTSQPAATWAQADFDDSAWPRYQGDLADFLGDYGVEVRDPWRALWPNRLCLRTAFGVADPAKVTDLKLTIVCIGGAVAYVNGQEAGRGHLPAGALQPLTPAESYPIAAYTTEDGATALPALGLTTSPEAKWLDRYAQRARTVTIDIPARLLVKGRNTLAIDLHAAPIAGPFPRDGWAHMGFRSATLASASGAGVIAYADACKGTHLWSANAVDQVTETPAEKSLIKRNWFWAVTWGRGLPVKGVQQGNPFDPVRPVRLTVPRNGTGSGQAVLSDPAGLKNVSATLDALKGPGGATLPAKGVQIRYAAQHDNIHYCDALSAAPPADVKSVPVWLIVQAPKDQAPGWYASTLRLAANGKTFAVPVQVLVTGLTLPDAKDFTSTVGMTQSPETIARQYGVPLWSGAHFRLLDPSFALLAQVGNDVIPVPVITSQLGAAAKDAKTKFKFGWAPMIRWMKRPQGLQPDLSILEKYLDAYTKHCAPPQAISLYIWGESSAKETAQGYENRRIPTRENTNYAPPRVQLWDPATGEVTEQQAPAIGDEGSEAFWKPMLDGVRALVVKRGWSERIIALGLGGDVRPGQKTVNLLKTWAPYARWNYLSHFSGDPGPNKEGKMIATGGAEMAMVECPDKGVVSRGAGQLDQFEKEMKNPRDFLLLPTDRWRHQENSPPLIFRTMESGPGCIGRLGLDFWKARQGGPRSTSFFSHVESLTMPGPDGALPTLRFQMLRENVQDWEIKRMMVAAYLKLPDEKRAPYRAVLNELARRVEFGSSFYLSQSELQYDWPAYVARLHETAADLLGTKSEARWAKPPVE